MQQVIYADVLIFINTVITFILLLSVKAFAGVRTEAGRMFLASLIGGVYSLIILAPKMHFLLLLLAKTGMCVSIVFIAFRVRSARKMLRCAVSFLIVSYLYAGVMYAFSYFFQNEFLVVNNGASYFQMRASSLIGITVLLYGVLLLLKKTVFRTKQSDLLYDITIVLGTREISVKALLDTGNSLRDVYTGKPVLILTAGKAESLIGVRVPFDYNEVFAGERTVCFRLLPVRTLNGEKVLPAFTAECVRISGAQTVSDRRNVCIAVTDHPLGQEKYQALIGAELI